MKRIYMIMLSIAIWIVSTANVSAQNLDNMPKKQRDSLLITKAKEIVLKHGPGYYREYKEPIVQRLQVPKEGWATKESSNSYAYRDYYEVKFLYDKTEELLEMNYAAKVIFWANTGEPASVMFGNNWGRAIKETDSTTEVEQILYQERQVIPLYDWQNHPENPDPINIDELRKKGYVEKANKQWVKITTKLDTPPAKAIKAIKRNGYEERNGRWIKVRQETPPAKAKK